MLPCQDPVLVPNPDTATDEELDVESINVARAYKDCKERHGNIVKFLRGLGK